MEVSKELSSSLLVSNEHHFCQIENGDRSVAVSRRLPSSLLAQAWHLFSLSLFSHIFWHLFSVSPPFLIFSGIFSLFLRLFSYFLAPFLCFSSFSRNFFLIFSVRRQSMGSRSGKHEVMSWYFIANCWWIRWWSDFMWKLYCWWLMIFDRVLSMIYNYPSKQFEGDLETSRERKQIS